LKAEKLQLVNQLREHETKTEQLNMRSWNWQLSVFIIWPVWCATFNYM